MNPFNPEIPKTLTEKWRVRVFFWVFVRFQIPRLVWMTQTKTVSFGFDFFFKNPRLKSDVVVRTFRCCFADNYVATVAMGEKRLMVTKIEFSLWCMTRTSKVRIEEACQRCLEWST